MLQTIISMGKSMNLNIVAEGIEDIEAANTLRDMGVNDLQGYYFSKPTPPEECSIFLDGNNLRYRAL